jgi:hypothetical protein
MGDALDLEVSRPFVQDHEAVGQGFSFIDRWEGLGNAGDMDEGLWACFPAISRGYPANPRTCHKENPHDP